MVARWARRSFHPLALIFFACARAHYIAFIVIIGPYILYCTSWTLYPPAFTRSSLHLHRAVFHCNLIYWSRLHCVFFGHSLLALPAHHLDQTWLVSLSSFSSLTYPIAFLLTRYIPLVQLYFIIFSSQSYIRLGLRTGLVALKYLQKINKNREY